MLGVLQPALLRADMRGVIGRRLADSLERHRTFALIHSDPETITGLEDVELVVEISAPPGRGLGEETQVRWLANTGLWLLAGVPGWLWADQAFSPGIEVRYFVTRQGASAVPESPPIAAVSPAQPFLEGMVDLSDAQSLSFARRAGPLQFVLQMLAPPWCIPSDRTEADPELFENFVVRMQRVISETLKDKLESEQLYAAASFPYLHTTLLDKGGPMLLLSRHEMTDVHNVGYTLCAREHFTSLMQQPKSGLLNWTGIGNVVDLLAAPVIGQYITHDSPINLRFRQKLYKYVYYADLPRDAEALFADLMHFSAKFIGEHGEPRTWSWTVPMDWKPPEGSVPADAVSGVFGQSSAVTGSH
jgi:hypothetical protein